MTNAQRADAPRRSAVGSALADLNQQDPRNEPARSPGRTLLWRALVEPIPPKTKIGLIDLPEEALAAQRILTCVGRIVQLGRFFGQSKTNAGLNLAEEDWPKVGECVLYQQYAGQEIHLRNGKLLRLIDDTEILMVIDDPDDIRGYI